MRLTFQLTTRSAQRLGAQVKDTYFEEVPGTVQLLLNELPFHMRNPAVKRGLIQLLDGVRDRVSSIIPRWVTPKLFRSGKKGRTTSETSNESDSDSSSEPPPVRSILLCISRLRTNYHRTVMIPVNTARVQDDEELFKTLKRAYRHEVGEIQWWLSMRTITGIRFVQVCLLPKKTIPEECMQLISA